MRGLPRNRSTRGIAAALAVLALAGQLGSFAHLVLVRHLTCAEHGELIELGRERAMAASAPRADAAVGAIGAVAAATVAAAATTETHGHEHCLIAPMRRDRIAAGAPASLDSARIDAYGTIGSYADTAVAPAIAVLVLAPKNSPPLA